MALKWGRVQARCRTLRDLIRWQAAPGSRLVVERSAHDEAEQLVQCLPVTVAVVGNKVGTAFALAATIQRQRARNRCGIEPVGDAGLGLFYTAGIQAEKIVFAVAALVNRTYSIGVAVCQPPGALFAKAGR